MTPSLHQILKLKKNFAGESNKTFFIRIPTEPRYIKSHPVHNFKYKTIPELAGRYVFKNIPLSRTYQPKSLFQLTRRIVNELPLPEAINWGNLRVMKWLDQLGFSQYRNTFHENGIDGKALVRLDAQRLVQLNIRNWDHITQITAAIRQLFGIELVKFIRSISLPARYPLTCQNLYHSNTGNKYHFITMTELFEHYKFIPPTPKTLNHWIQLENWLRERGHVDEHIIFGATNRKNLYKVRKAPLLSSSKKGKHEPEMFTSPCVLVWEPWRDTQPWTMKYLLDRVVTNEIFRSNNLDLFLKASVSVPINKTKSQLNTTAAAAATTTVNVCHCVFLCTCKWSAKEFVVCKPLSVLKKSQTTHFAETGTLFRQFGDNKTDPT